MDSMCGYFAYENPPWIEKDECPITCGGCKHFDAERGECRCWECERYEDDDKCEHFVDVNYVQMF